MPEETLVWRRLTGGGGRSLHRDFIYSLYVSWYVTKTSEWESFYRTDYFIKYMRINASHFNIYIITILHIKMIKIYIYICHTGVVYNNISIVFVLWASSINNKVGLVPFANVYLRYQSVVICRRWLYSLSWTWN